MSQFNWPITQKTNLKLWRLTKLEGSILRYRVPFLWPHIIPGVKGGQHLPKAYKIKVRCCGEHFGEHIGNLGNTLGNLMGT